MSGWLEEFCKLADQELAKHLPPELNPRITIAYGPVDFFRVSAFMGGQRVYRQIDAREAQSMLHVPQEPLFGAGLMHAICLALVSVPRNDPLAAAVTSMLDTPPAVLREQSKRFFRFLADDLLDGWRKAQQ